MCGADIVARNPIGWGLTRQAAVDPYGRVGKRGIYGINSTTYTDREEKKASSAVLLCTRSSTTYPEMN